MTIYGYASLFRRSPPPRSSGNRDRFPRIPLHPNPQLVPRSRIDPARNQDIAQFSHSGPFRYKRVYGWAASMRAESARTHTGTSAPEEIITEISRYFPDRARLEHGVFRAIDYSAGFEPHVVYKSDVRQLLGHSAVGVVGAPTAMGRFTFYASTISQYFWEVPGVHRYDLSAGRDSENLIARNHHSLSGWRFNAISRFLALLKGGASVPGNFLAPPPPPPHQGGWGFVSNGRLRLAPRLRLQTPPLATEVWRAGSARGGTAEAVDEHIRGPKLSQ